MSTNNTDEIVLSLTTQTLREKLNQFQSPECKVIIRKAIELLSTRDESRWLASSYRTSSVQTELRNVEGKNSSSPICEYKITNPLTEAFTQTEDVLTLYAYTQTGPINTHDVSMNTVSEPQYTVTVSEDAADQRQFREVLVYSREENEGVLKVSEYAPGTDSSSAVNYFELEERSEEQPMPFKISSVNSLASMRTLKPQGRTRGLKVSSRTCCSPEYLQATKTCQSGNVPIDGSLALEPTSLNLTMERKRGLSDNALSIVPRRRGRPKGLESIKKSINSDHSHVHSQGSDELNRVLKKRRGRPKSVINLKKSINSDHSQGLDEHNGVLKKHRGRPKALKNIKKSINWYHSNVHSQGSDELNQVLKKRRGRPKAVKNIKKSINWDHSNVHSQGSDELNGVLKKRRGRPKGVKNKKKSWNSDFSDVHSYVSVELNREFESPVSVTENMKSEMCQNVSTGNGLGVQIPDSTEDFVRSMNRPYTNDTQEIGSTVIRSDIGSDDEL